MRENVKKLLDSERFWAVAVFVAATAAFLPALGVTELISDDLYYILKARRLDFSFATLVEPVIGLSSPLTTLSFLLDQLVWGERFIWGGHLLNILLHSGVATVFFYLARELVYRRADGRELRLSPAWAGTVALIFALHPQRVESVAWLAERKDGLAMLLGLSALWLFYRALRRDKISRAAVALFVLSLLAKPLWILFPLLGAALIWFDRRRADWKTALRLLWPAALVTALFMLWQLPATVQTLQKTVSSGAVPPLFKAETILHNYGFYFLKTFIPGELFPVYPYYHPVYDARWVTVVPLLLLLVPLLGIRREFRTPVLFGYLPALGCFALALAPVVGFSRVGSTDFADRYSYLPSLFLWLAVAFQLRAIPRRAALADWLPVLAALYLGGLLWQTERYLPAWRDNQSFVLAGLRHPEPNFNIAISRACQLYYKGDFAAALEVAAAKLPESARYPADFNRLIRIFKLSLNGMVLFRSGRPDEGIKFLNTVYLSPYWSMVQNFPNDFAQQVFSVGAQYHRQKFNDRRAAENLYLRAAEITRIFDPVYTAFYSGMAALMREDYGAAVNFFTEATRLAPGDRRCRQNLNYAKQKLAEKTAEK